MILNIGQLAPTFASLWFEISKHKRHCYYDWDGSVTYFQSGYEEFAYKSLNVQRKYVHGRKM